MQLHSFYEVATQILFVNPNATNVRKQKNLKRTFVSTALRKVFFFFCQVSQRKKNYKELLC